MFPVGQVLKGLPYLHLTLLLNSNVCYADRGSLLSLSGSGVGNSSIYVKVLPAVLKGMSRLVCLTGCTKQCHFLVHLFQVCLAWHTIGIYFYAISTFLEPHCLHKASNHPVISKLMCHFYLQCPPHKCFDPWDVECLLSLLESWAPASSLTTFKLVWKTATVLAHIFVGYPDGIDYLSFLVIFLS